ncbi:MAG: hypothetical protein M3Y57_19350 [Acidobacteriota bacterium]|nr:hypothetical protein [Acidobacteriota bacterium]
MSSLVQLIDFCAALSALSSGPIHPGIPTEEVSLGPGNAYNNRRPPKCCAGYCFLYCFRFHSFARTPHSFASVFSIRALARSAGSDSLHGGFSFRTRNSDLDARNPFAAANPPFSRNGYEANLSGPILKKRLYVVLSADREDQQQVQPILACLPSGLLNQEVLALFTRNLLPGRIDRQVSESRVCEI